MKLKKEIATLLLASALLTSSLTACNTAQNGGNDIDNTTTTESTALELPGSTTPEMQESTTPEIPNQSPDNESNNTPNSNEVVRDVPELGKLKLFSGNYLTKASIWRDEDGELFLYINEWDAYRQLSGLSSYHNWFYFTDNCIVIDDKTTTISLVDQNGKHNQPTIITYHFNRDNALIELHTVPLNIIASSEYDTFFVNMHTADHGYYFLTPSMDGSSDWRMDGVQGWPLFVFETTDGGKSWNQISTNTFTLHTSDAINIVKFVSPTVGIISFRYVNLKDLCERTYLTVDGGLTWNQISQLPYPSNEEWGYSEVVDMALIGDCYYLTVKISDNAGKELQFGSKDLQNWTFEKSFDASLENYIGTWYDSQNPPDELTISSVSDGKIECQLGVYRLGLYYLTAIQEDGKFIFTDENNLISGTMQFSNGSILVVIEQSNIEYYQNGRNWLFTIKGSEDSSNSGTTEDTELLISADFASYDSIITTYRKIVETCLYYEILNEEDYFTFPNEEARALYDEIFFSTLTLFPSSSNVTITERYNRFGYTVQDLNKDGIDELILRLDDHTVIAVFTMANGKPILLGNFWNRHRCWIDTEGLLHISGSNSAWNSVWHIYRISDQTGNLILLEEGGTDGYDEASGTTLFYKLVNNEKVYITEEEYDIWYDSLPYQTFEVTKNISDYLIFTPIFDENHPTPSPYIPDAKG